MTNEVHPGGGGESAGHEESPWLRREEWARGEVRARRVDSSFSLVFATIWNALVFVLLVIVFFAAEGDKTLAYLGLAPFVVVGLVLLWQLLRNGLRRSRFGASRLHLEIVPGEVGGQLRGTVRAGGIKGPPEAGFDVQLRSERHVVFRGERHEPGRGTKTGHRSWVLWQDDYNVPGLAGTDGVSVPVLFDIPESSRETSRDAPSPYDEAVEGVGEWCEWLLAVRASLPGVDYCAEFPVPVFKTDAPRHQAEGEPGDPWFDKRPASGSGLGVRFGRSEDGSTVLELPSPQGAVLLLGCFLTLAVSAWFTAFAPEYRTAAAFVFVGSLVVSALAIAGLLVTPRRMIGSHRHVDILYGGYGLTRQIQLRVEDVKAVSLETVWEPGHGGRPRVYLEVQGRRRIEIDPRMSGHSGGERFATELCERFHLPAFTTPLP